jgi:Domain of unknown function (DUF5671)
VIAPSRGAAYRRFYLYSALSVAVIAVAVAAALLLHIALQSLGFGQRQPAGDVSRNISLAAALLAVAVPVGGAHLWLILRSLADPTEGANGVRHQYLNLWVTFALLVVLFAGQAAFSALSQQDGADVTVQSSILIVAAGVGAIAAWWISRTPPSSQQPRVRSAVVVMLVAIAVAAFSLGNAASGAGGLFAYPYASPNFYPRNFDPRSFQEQTLRSSYFVAGLGLTIWSIGFAWQRPFRETRDRLGLALAGYGVGSTLLLVGAAFLIGGAVRFASDAAQAEAFTGPWAPVAAGALLVVVNGALLVHDRGRNGHPAVTTTRLLLAFPALVGLGLIVGAAGLAWHALLERDLMPAQHIADDLTHAAALLAVGALAYVPSWFAFRRRTTAESAVRRFYLFTVVCLALVAGLVSSVIVVYNAITVLAGVSELDAGRTALTWLVPAVTLAAIFVGHLRPLLRDQRQTRAAEPPPADSLLALLEDVRAGRVSIERAAATIRGPLA